MAEWFKKNKKFIASLVVVILQQLGVIPTLGGEDPAPSVNTKAVSE